MHSGSPGPQSRPPARAESPARLVAELDGRDADAGGLRPLTRAAVALLAGAIAGAAAVMLTPSERAPSGAATRSSQEFAG